MNADTVDHAEALEWMATLDDSCVDLIVTDPPYFKVKDEEWDRQWAKPEAFIAWLGTIADEWQRILKPNGSLYCFASPQMAARVEVMLSERFNVLNSIRWNKDAGWHNKMRNEDQRIYLSPWEACVFCEQYEADNAAKGEAGYVAKCDELRGFVFEPLRAYLDGEREAAGWVTSDIARAWMTAHGKESKWVTRLAGHWFERTQWELPTERNYLWLRDLFNAKGDGHLRREYEDLRREYEDLRREYEDLRREYEDLRRPFAVTADVPYTDVWTFKAVQGHQGKHVCQKPADMADHIVRASSKEGAVVCDTFAGSGALLMGAARNGRHYIGCDSSELWAQRAAFNCKMANAQQRLAL
jgi:site-specific DNA-methyltransferase (adenine-specific)